MQENEKEKPIESKVRKPLKPLKKHKEYVKRHVGFSSSHTLPNGDKLVLTLYSENNLHPTRK